MPWFEADRVIVNPLRISPDVDTMPTSWTLVIDDCDFEKVVIADITGYTNGGQLTYDNLRDYVTSGLIIVLGVGLVALAGIFTVARR